jgi:hypothetical protein
MATIRTGNRSVLLVVDLNVAMTWLDYPGRKSATAKADAVTFI